MPAATDSRNQALFDFISTCDLDGVKSIAKGDFNLGHLNPETGETVMQAIVLATVYEPTKGSQTLECAKWLLRCGADPDKKGSKVGKTAYRHDLWFEKDSGGKDPATEISFVCEGHSAVTLLARVLKMISDLKRAEHWKTVSELLRKLLIVIGKNKPLTAQAERVSINSSLLELWESARGDSSSHDVTIEATNGEVTTHAHMLNLASPVLSAMLSSSMKEGKSKRVTVDCSVASIEFLLDLLYTGTSGTPFSVDAGLPALEVAHRWQLEFIVSMLQHAAASALCVENFSKITEAAIRMELECLKQECEEFAAANPVVGEAANLPPVVRQWLAKKQRVCLDPPKAKKQRYSF
mmetsp:Transcript_21511/g.50149  ORF Transcript_21511/g.50149 Transcript_21511/m.50149 type:complete len:351 (+) Transcript_21511:147-1199(+)|eukprot:CAMPEP_0178410022 /NCGR_PEP_ID=MMETSP0689_2-20121128/20765_1 /TAXON_ID=160604 /ORGANISM="Amphidinium massartii, Strain CS-259" /LENGTH=350 /DNA_ID=CAMNT_0020031185 /DNA_START=123 /DNA_END=1175 /DNA_ORIENTATION=-